jgi:hypothetical protein
MKNLLHWLRQKHAWQKLVTLLVLGLAVHLILPQITALKNSWNVLTSCAIGPWRWPSPRSF